MPLKKDITDQLEQILKTGDYELYKGGSIPGPGDNRLTFGNSGVSFDAVTLYVDMRGSTKVLHEHRAHNVAKVHKAFLYVGTKLISENGGSIRSYNGDSILAFFAGNSKAVVTKAIKAAMQMKYLLTDKDVQPHFARYGAIDFGIGVDVGTILCVKAGLGQNENHNDLIWLGEAVNRAVRLSDSGKSPHYVWISNAVRELQDDEARYLSQERRDMWEATSVSYNGAPEKAWCTKTGWVVS